MTIATLLAVLLTLPGAGTDRSTEKQAQLTAIAAGVQAAARDADEAAFVIAWGEHETRYSLRIHRGQCKPRECDRGRARGPWQNHRNGLTDEQWAGMHGVEWTQVQAREAMRRARWALRQCPADKVRGAFRVLGGNGCHRALRGEEQRVATFKSVRAKLSAAEAEPLLRTGPKEGRRSHKPEALGSMPRSATAPPPTAVDATFPSVAPGGKGAVR